MSLTSILRIGASGLKVSQAGLRGVSDNIANVNTPGYVRKVVQQETAVIAGVGAGVQISSVTRAADLYLQRTSLDAASESGRAKEVAAFLDRAQIMFGDPSNDTSFFKELDDIFSAFSTAAEDPTSNLRRSAAVSETTRFFDDARKISSELTTLRSETDVRLAAATDQVNGLLTEISKLNKEISAATIRGRDATGAENAQSQLINELSTFMNVRIGPKQHGGVVLRAGDGTELVNMGPAQLTFDRAAAGGLMSITPFEGRQRPFSDGLEGGEIKGLIELRQTVLPGISEQLGELTTRAADALNKAHNASSAAPAPAQMVGRNTGLGSDLANMAAGFTGRTSINVMDSAGLETRRVDIDFDLINAGAAGGLSIDGVAQPAFAVGAFPGQLNAALGAGRTATFTGGVLTLNTTNANEGFAIVDDPAAPSSRGGRGFSHFFGLNDLVRADRATFYETGLRSGDPHGFTGGQTVQFRVTTPGGGLEQDVTVTIPNAPANAMSDLLSTASGALNDPAGMGRYGVFALDAQGSLSFTPSPNRPVVLSVREDTTTRGAGGPKLTDLFGVGSDRRSTRAESFYVRKDIRADVSKLAFAQMDHAAAVGGRRVAKGDNDGAFALADAGEAPMRFEAAGEVVGLNMALTRYAAELGGVVGRTASYALERRDNAALVAKEADARRAGAEGVNLDEELIQLTTYQQSYNASARLIQAASEMYQTLVDLI